VGVTSNPKRHHFVPKVYLRAWANERDRVAVRRRGSASAHVTSVDNVAVVNGLNGVGLDALHREDLYGALESRWRELRHELTCGRLRGSDRQAVALFMAFQRHRTSEGRMRVDFALRAAASTGERPIKEPAMRRFLQEIWGVASPSKAEVQAACDYANYTLAGPDNVWHEAEAHSLAGAVTRIAPRLEALSWRVEVCRKPMLLTSDAPVTCWRPRSDRDLYDGLGIANAQEVWFPLSPRHLLVLSPGNGDLDPFDVEPRRFQFVNAEIASRSYESVVGTVHRARRIEQLDLGDVRPAMRFNLAPGYQKVPGREDRYIGDILHMWVPAHDGV
jgi:hypothetical protein